MQLLLAVWDGGRVLEAERERLATLIHGRLDATLDPAVLAKSAASPGTTSGALAVSLPEACRLSDALAGQLRQRLALDPAADANAARVKDLRASLDRLRDQVALEPDSGRSRAQKTWDDLAARINDLTERLQRGGDVGGLLGPLENDTALFERDLIVGGAERRDTRDRAVAAAELREDLLARSAALEQLAARCVEAVDPAPKYAVPDVEALGAVPDSPRDLDAYRARLGRVGDAMNLAHASYAAALSAHDDLVVRLDALTLKASARRASRERARPCRGRGDGARGAEPAALPDRGRGRLGRHVRRVADVCSKPHLQGGSPMKCQQPGCTGTIVDGYCDVCGMAPAEGGRRHVRVTGSRDRR